MSFNNSGILNDLGSVTPHATNQNHWMGLYVGGAGDVKVKTAGGTDVTFSSVPAGGWLPVATQLVYAVGTTATLILGGR